MAYAYSTTPIAISAPDFDTYNFGGAFDLNEDGKVDLVGTKFRLMSYSGSTYPDTDLRYALSKERGR
jgi:hypothetical protein